MQLTNLLSKALYKIAGILKAFADKSIIDQQNVVVPSSSRLNLDGLKLKRNCCISLGEQTQVLGSLIFDKDNASIEVGSRAFISGSIIAADSVCIGDDVLVSWNVTISDHNSHALSFSYRSHDATDWLKGKKNWEHVKVLPITICDKAWIGFNSIILKGVTVGEGAVVGAGSVVTKDVPPWTIVAGNPARVIREIPENER